MPRIGTRTSGASAMGVPVRAIPEDTPRDTALLSTENVHATDGHYRVRSVNSSRKTESYCSSAADCGISVDVTDYGGGSPGRSCKGI